MPKKRTLWTLGSTGGSIESSFLQTAMKHVVKDFNYFRKITSNPFIFVT